MIPHKTKWCRQSLLSIKKRWNYCHCQTPYIYIYVYVWAHWQILHSWGGKWCWHSKRTPIPTLPLQTYTPSTYQPYKRPHTLHTYPTPPYLRYIHTLPLLTYKNLHTYPTPTTPTPYSACLHYACTPALWACCQVVRFLFASDGILCAAIFIGEIIVFEFDWFVESLLKKGEVLHSHGKLQF